MKDKGMNNQEKVDLIMDALLGLAKDFMEETIKPDKKKDEDMNAENMGMSEIDWQLVKAISFNKPLNDIKKLIVKGGNVNAIFHDPEDANKTSNIFQFAIMHESIAMVEFLIANGADVNLACGELGVTPLMVACSKRKLDSMKLLLKAGADINAQDNDGDAALHYYFISDEDEPWEHLGILRLLLDHKADPLILNKRNISPLMLGVVKAGAELEYKKGHILGLLTKAASKSSFNGKE